MSEVEDRAHLHNGSSSWRRDLIPMPQSENIINLFTGIGLHGISTPLGQMFPAHMMSHNATMAAMMTPQNRMLPWIMHQNYLLHCSGQGIPTGKEERDQPQSQSSSASSNSESRVRRQRYQNTSLPRDDNENSTSEESDEPINFSQRMS